MEDKDFIEFTTGLEEEELPEINKMAASSRKKLLTVVYQNQYTNSIILKSIVF